MNTEFTEITGEKRGTFARMLRESYAGLLEIDPFWECECAGWDLYDQEIFNQPTTVGACLFLTRIDGAIAGFASWDPRQRPEYGIVGHNCILPAFRGRGLGRLQILEVLRRFLVLGVSKARVSTIDHPFFVPAQRTYTACGFRELRRESWVRNSGMMKIEYEKKLGQSAAGPGPHMRGA